MARVAESIPLPPEVLDSMWLADLRRGMSAHPNQSRQPLPRLIPLFPASSFVPGSECGHRGPLPAGSPFVCMVCHESGHDDHPGLVRDPASDPPPEPTVVSTKPQVSRRRKEIQAPNGCQTTSDLGGFLAGCHIVTSNG